MALAGVAVIAAAVVVAFVRGGSSTHPRAAAPAHPPVARWNAANVHSFAAGGGFVWTVTSHATRRTERWYLQRRDPATGAVLATTRIATPEEFIAYGGRRVWTWGGGDGGYPSGLLETHDRAGKLVSNVRLGYGKGLQPTSTSLGSILAFAPGGTAYGVRENGGWIDAFGHDDLTTANAAVAKVRGAQRLFVVGHALVVVGGKRVVGVYATGGGWPPAHSAAVRFHGLPLANAPGGFWSLVGGRLVRESLAGKQLAAPISLPGDPVDAISAPAGGLYVSLQRDRRRPGGTSELAYYSLAALRSGSSRPTATVAGSFDNIALDPAGGIVAGTAGTGRHNGRLGHWDPTGQRSG